MGRKIFTDTLKIHKPLNYTLFSARRQLLSGARRVRG